MINTEIEVYKNWYEGFVKNVHEFEVSNGSGNSTKVQRYSLGLAKKICEEYADMLLNEKVEINCNEKEKLDKILKRNNFFEMANKGIEISFALGIGAFVIGYDDISNPNEDTVRIEFVQAENIEILSSSNGVVTDIQFKTKLGENTIVSRHTKKEDIFIIENKCLDKDNKEIELPNNIVSNFESEYQLFHLIKPNVVNNKDLSSPYGISIFANAIPLLSSIDIVFDSLINEFIVGRKRIFISAELLKVNEKTAEPIFDVNDTVFYYLEQLNDKEMLKESNLEIRSEEHISTIKSLLSLIGDKVGLGSDFFKYENQGVSTATEIISNNMGLYRSIKKQEIMLESSLVYMFETILKIIGYEDVVTINFDDTIFEDTGTIFNRALLKLNSGIIDKAQFYVETEKMTRNQALKLIHEMGLDVPHEENIDLE